MIGLLYSMQTKLKDPVAIFQGSKDKVVPPDQSEQIVEKLRQRGIPHIYCLYEGEGHGFRKQETIADYFKTNGAVHPGACIICTLNSVYSRTGWGRITRMNILDDFLFL